MVDHLLRTKRLRESYASLVPSSRQPEGYRFFKQPRLGSACDFALSRWQKAGSEVGSDRQHGWRLQAHQFAVNDMLVLDSPRPVDGSLLITAGLLFTCYLFMISTFLLTFSSSVFFVFFRNGRNVEDLAIRSIERSITTAATPIELGVVDR